jgi:hypothetical protein
MSTMAEVEAVQRHMHFLQTSVLLLHMLVEELPRPQSWHGCWAGYGDGGRWH